MAKRRKHRKEWGTRQLTLLALGVLGGFWALAWAKQQSPVTVIPENEPLRVNWKASDNGQ